MFRYHKGMPNPIPRSWSAYGSLKTFNGVSYYHLIGDVSHGSYSPVTVIEDETGDYTGWLAADQITGKVDESKILYVHRTENFMLAFSGWVEQAELRNKGRRVTVKVESNH